MHTAAQLKEIQQSSNRLRTGAPTDVALSIVIPCFNEADGIANLRERLFHWAKLAPPEISWECVLIDDGSCDATAETIRDVFGSHSQIRLVQHSSNQGLTKALSTGFSSAQGRWIACLDADCTYDPMILTTLLEKTEQGFDVVTASPYGEEGKVENVAAWRIALSRTASRMYGFLFRSKLSCYTCCVRIYDAELLKDCPPLRSQGFVGVTELLWQLDRRGARIGEVPAVLRPRVTGVSKMRTLRTATRHIKLMMRILSTR